MDFLPSTLTDDNFSSTCQCSEGRLVDGSLPVGMFILIIFLLAVYCYCECTICLCGADNVGPTGGRLMVGSAAIRDLMAQKMM